MSGAAGRDFQRRSKAGFITAAALFYLSSAVETEAEPAADEQTTTEQAPAPSPQQTTPAPSAQQPPSDTPATSEQKSERLPTVSVQANRSRAPSTVRATPAAATPVAGPPPATGEPAGSGQSSNANPPLGATPYQVSNPGIARLPVPFLNMPQTVNVIPQAIIQEQSVSTVEQALQYIPGITFSAGEGGQQGDGPIIRGFVARGDLFRDGIRDPGWYVRDVFSIDRIEVYKGPSAFAFGRGATGGAINYVTKLPTGARYIESTSTLSTGNGYREMIDASGKTDNVSGRIQGVWQDVNTPTRDQIWTKRWGVAPSMVYDFQQGTKATLYYIYQGEQGVSDYGFTYLPQPSFNPQTGRQASPGYYGTGAPTPPLPIPRTNFLGLAGGPLGDITETETHIITEKIEHEFDKDLKVSNATRYIDNERFARVTAPRNVGIADNNFPGRAAIPNVRDASPSFWAPPTFPFNYPVELLTYGRERRERETDNTYLVNQTDLVGKFITGIAEHQMSAGLEAAYETRHQDRRDICDSTNLACRTSAYYPNPFSSPTGGPIVNFLPIETRATDYAAYVSDQVKITKYFELLASLRYDLFGTDYSDPNQALVVNRNLSRTDNLFSYRFGAVIHPTEKSTIYAAYGNSYNPSAELGTLTNASVAALAPEQTRTIEAGAKADVLGGQLSLAGAVFRIEKINLRIVNPFDQNVSVLDGIARVDGIELGATGKVTDRWSVFTGYSYLESTILDTRDKSIAGRHLQNTPRNNFTMWTTYDLTSRWTIGGGAIYQSLGWANNTNTAYVPEFWKFDAMISYKVDDKSIVQLNVYNLTDTLYYAQYFGANVVPASGRWASLTYRTKW
jgi:catecholate siderophore receptor